MAKLILIRHGESEWNAKGLWTGWTDIELSEKGKDEARKAADAIKDLQIDISFTSKLKRAQHTLNIILETLHIQPPVTEHEALNERNYGDFTGKNKWEIKAQLGDTEFQQLRRGWDHKIPNGESLKEVSQRVIPYFHQVILPYLFQQKNVLIVAHGNSIRALMKELEGIPDNDIATVELATGEAVVYEMNTDGQIVSKKRLGSGNNTS